MSFAHSWRRYWFEPAELVNLAVLRLVLVGYQLTQVRLLGSLSVERTELPDQLYDPLPILHLLIAPIGWRYRPSAEVLEIVVVITLIFGLLALIGLLTNLSVALFTIGNVFMQGFYYSFGDFHHGQGVVMIALGALALSPSGRVLSIDSLRRGLGENAAGPAFRPLRALEEKSRYARWPLLLIMWVMALIYLSAALAKLKASGFEWANGYTLQYYLVRDGLRWNADLGVWLGQQHALVVFLSWFTLIFEATFVLALVVPILALVYVPLGVALHLGIQATMRAGFFGFLACFTVWVPWQSLFARVGELWRKMTRGGLQVTYRPGEPGLAVWLTLLSWSDWFQCLRFTERESAPASPEQLDSADNERSGRFFVAYAGTPPLSGLSACRAALQYLPILWPLLLLSYVPRVGNAARRACKWIGS